MHNTTWGNRFITAAIIQGGIVTSMALSMVGSSICFRKKFKHDTVFIFVSLRALQKWFFLGIILYLVLIVAIAVTAVFYIHLEVNLKRRISGMPNVLAWIHLVGMNVGGPLATILMIFAGLSGRWRVVCFYRRKNRCTEC